MSFWQQSSDIFAQFEEDKISRDARLLHFEGTGHAAQSQKDGLVSVRLTRICDHSDPEALAAELEAIGLWERTEGGWLITDYLRNNRASDEVERSRRLARERTERSRRHKQGDHSQCTKSRFCPEGELDTSPHVTRDTTRDTTRDVTPSYLNSPHLTVGEGESEGRDTDSGASDEPTGLAPVGLASTPEKERPSPLVTVHAFTDSTFNSQCDFCGLKKSNAMHQSELPADVLALADVIAEQGAWSEIVLHRETRGWRRWEFKFTAPTVTGNLTTAPHHGDDGRGHVDSVGIRLPMSLPVSDPEDEAEWVAFYERVMALVDPLAPGATSLDEQSVFWEDGSLLIDLAYPSSDDRKEQVEADNKARKYLLSAFEELVQPYFHKRIYAAVQTTEAVA